MGSPRGRVHAPRPLVPQSRKKGLGGFPHFGGMSVAGFRHHRSVALDVGRVVRPCLLWRFAVRKRMFGRNGTGSGNRVPHPVRHPGGRGGDCEKEHGEDGMGTRRLFRVRLGVWRVSRRGDGSGRLVVVRGRVFGGVHRGSLSGFVAGFLTRPRNRLPSARLADACGSKWEAAPF